MSGVDTLAAVLAPHLPDSKTNQAKDELSKLGKDLSKIPMLRGASHTLTIPASSTASLNHGLGRTPQGWIVCGITGGSPAFYETSSNKRAISFVNTLATDVVVRLWVF